MKKALAALVLLILFTATTYAQDYQLFPPPQKPYYERTMAPQELWIYDTTIKMTEKGYVFSAKVKALFFAGLDAKGNRIEFKTGKNVVQDDPIDFELIDEVFRGEAYLKVGVDNKTVARATFEVTGGLGDKKKNGEKDGVIEFKPIDNKLKLLPTRYKIIAAINPGRQRFRNIIWTDREERTMTNQGSILKIVRDDPRKASDVSVDAFILVKFRENGLIETYKEGAVSFYAMALTGAGKVKDTEKRIKALDEQVKNEKNFAKRTNLESSLYVQKTNLYKYNYWSQPARKKILEQELEKAKKEEFAFKQAVHKYDRKVKKAIVDVLKQISDFNKEVYFTSYGCMPGWKSSNAEKMKKITKEYKIDKYLSKGEPGIEVEKGKWKGDKWLDNLKDNWVPKIEEIKTNFRKIFGTGMEDEDGKGNKAAFDYYGMSEDGTRIFWQPVLATGYEKLYETLFKDDLLTKTIQALANLLTEKHSDARVIKYPFVVEGSINPSPAPNTAYSYSQKLGLVKKTICRLIYSCSLPAETLINPEDVKKEVDERKTEWVCPNCGAKSAFRPPNGNCPVCGTPMEEKPITNDDNGIGEGGR